MKAPLAFLAIALGASGAAMGGDAVALQLKGVKIGDPPESACQGAAITTEWEDQAKALASRGIKVRSFNASQCAAPVSATAGIQAREPAHILFFDGKAVFLRFTLEAVPIEVQGDILQALKIEFGPWQVKHSSAFSHFRWTRNGVELEVERVKVDLTGDDLNFFLRDTAKFRPFSAEVDRASKALERYMSLERGRTVLQKD